MPLRLLGTPATPWVFDRAERHGVETHVTDRTRTVLQQRDAPLRLRVELCESIGPLRDELRQLAEASSNVFATPEWLETWWKYFGSGHARIRTCRDPAGRLVALLPLYAARRGPVRLMRFIGHGAGDELGPVCGPTDRVAAGVALRDTLASEDFDLFLGEEMPAEPDWGLPGLAFRRIGSPIIALEGATWEEFLAGRSRHFRRSVRWRDNRLRRDYGAQFRLGDPSQLETDFETLLSLHDLRWGRDASAFSGRRETAFHREFARLARDRGWLRLWFLELDGRPAAAWYGFRFGNSYAFYQSGRDPAFQRLSIGSALLLHTIRMACEESVDEYRFLRGNEGYKYQLATNDPGLVTIGVARGMRGRTALGLASRFRGRALRFTRR